MSTWLLFEPVLAGKSTTSPDCVRQPGVPDDRGLDGEAARLEAVQGLVVVLYCTAL